MVAGHHQYRKIGFTLLSSPRRLEAYAIKTATLVGYVDDLISKKKIPSWDNALGLYVIGRPDPELKQLENAIIAEKRSNQLRIISADSLLSLAEMMNAYDVSHEDILAVLRPSGPTIDPVVDLMARSVAQQITEKRSTEAIPVATPTESVPETTGTAISLSEDAPSYWLTPVKSDEEETAEETISTLVGEEHIYAFSERTPGRRHIKPGDWICFYSTRKGVVAHAQVASIPRKELHSKVRHAEKYPWVFDLDSEELYLNEPVIIDASLRTNLDAFKDKDINKNRAWYVQANNKITEHDFDILTGRRSAN